MSKAMILKNHEDRITGLEVNMYNLRVDNAKVKLSLDNSHIVLRKLEDIEKTFNLLTAYLGIELKKTPATKTFVKKPKL